jgi:transposase
MPRTHNTYPPDFRAEAVRLVLSGVAVSQVSKDLGVNDQTIRNWVKQHQVDHGKAEGLMTTELEELRQLRRENRVLRQERDILKKAAAFFANETNRIQ